MFETRFFPSAFLVIALALAGAPPAFAHMKMVSSSPADGSAVAPGLRKISVTFSHAMRLTIFKVKHLDDDDTIKPTSALPKSFRPSVDIPVEPLEPGRYQVLWNGIGKDGHVMHGTFKFSVNEKPRDKAQ